jgi:hypothetical protein
VETVVAAIATAKTDASAKLGTDEERGNPRGRYLRARRAPVRSRALGSPRVPLPGSMAGRLPRRAARTFSFAASSCLLDAMV